MSELVAEDLNLATEQLRNRTKDRSGICDCICYSASSWMPVQLASDGCGMRYADGIEVLNDVSVVEGGAERRFATVQNDNANLAEPDHPSGPFIIDV